MKKTLIVNYSPRIASNTKKLVDYFIELNQDKTNLTILDIAKNPPDLLLEERLNLYVKRNFNGEQLIGSETKHLTKNDQLMQQVIDADFIVLAYPMYNFSLPATVKAWVDAITQAGSTFEMTESGTKGLCNKKQALVLMTSGGDFYVEPLRSINFATPLINTCFDFLGIKTEHISAFGMQQYSNKIDSILENAKREILSLSEKWY